jgi:hypothetical protein
MDEIEYKYWEILFISCESNNRRMIARTPIDWDKYQVIDRITIGGCGDDVAEIVDVFEANDRNYSLDFCNYTEENNDLPEGWLNWNTLSLDQMVEYLRKKYMFSSTGDAKCIYHLIEFYDKHK